MSETEVVNLRSRRYTTIRHSVDEEPCKGGCDKEKDVCSTFRKFMDGLQPKKTSGGWEHSEREHKDIKEELCEFLTDKNISLMDQLCHGEEEQSVLQTLLSIDEGCEIITNQLDSLKEPMNSSIRWCSWSSWAPSGCPAGLPLRWRSEREKSFDTAEFRSVQMQLKVAQKYAAVPKCKNGATQQYLKNGGDTWSRTSTGCWTS